MEPSFGDDFALDFEALSTSGVTSLPPSDFHSTTSNQFPSSSTPSTIDYHDYSPNSSPSQSPFGTSPALYNSGVILYDPDLDDSLVTSVPPRSLTLTSLPSTNSPSSPSSSSYNPSSYQGQHPYHHQHHNQSQVQHQHQYHLPSLHPTSIPIDMKSSPRQQPSPESHSQISSPKLPLSELTGSLTESTPTLSESFNGFRAQNSMYSMSLPIHGSGGLLSIEGYGNSKVGKQVGSFHHGSNPGPLSHLRSAEGGNSLDMDMDMDMNLPQKQLSSFPYPLSLF